jgi:hypothetical protein
MSVAGLLLKSGIALQIKPGIDVQLLAGDVIPIRHQKRGGFRHVYRLGEALSVGS